MPVGMYSVGKFFAPDLIPDPPKYLFSEIIKTVFEMNSKYVTDLNTIRLLQYVYSVTYLVSATRAMRIAIALVLR